VDNFDLYGLMIDELEADEPIPELEEIEPLDWTPDSDPWLLDADFED
jgi:hypothetical protein